MESITPTKNIFDYYSKKENNFTKALINVMENAFKNEDKNIISAFLNLLKPSLTYSADMEFKLLKGMDGGTYDAAILSENKGYYLAIETKIREQSLKSQQLRKHCKDLSHNHNYFKIKLLVTITPDLEKGNYIKKLNSIKCNSRHINWKKIFDVFNEVNKQNVSQITSFLIYEFNSYLDNKLLKTNSAGGIIKAIKKYFPKDYEKGLYKGTKKSWYMNRLYWGIEGKDKIMVIYKSETKEIIGEATIEDIEENEYNGWGKYKYIISNAVRYPKAVPKKSLEKKIKDLNKFLSGRPNFRYISKDELKIIRNEAGYLLE